MPESLALREETTYGADSWGVSLERKTQWSRDAIQIPHLCQKQEVYTTYNTVSHNDATCGSDYSGHSPFPLSVRYEEQWSIILSNISYISFMLNYFQLPGTSKLPLQYICSSSSYSQTQTNHGFLQMRALGPEEHPSANMSKCPGAGSCVHDMVPPCLSAYSNEFEEIQ